LRWLTANENRPIVSLNRNLEAIADYEVDTK
jgi:hypothetical protein